MPDGLDEAINAAHTRLHTAPANDGAFTTREYADRSKSSVCTAHRQLHMLLEHGLVERVNTPRLRRCGGIGALYPTPGWCYLPKQTPAPQEDRPARPAKAGKRVKQCE